MSAPTAPWTEMHGGPALLEAVGAWIGATPVQAPDDTSIQAIGRLLREGVGRGTDAQSLGAAGLDPARLEWLRWSEAGGGQDPVRAAARAAAAWTALGTGGGEVVLAVGADADGVPGVSVGLPPGASGQWTSDLAPDLLWTPGHPAGWQVVARGGSPEAVAHPRAVPRARAGQPAPEGSVPGLSRLLALPLRDWCVLLRLRPVHPATTVTAQRGLVGLEREVGRRLSSSAAVAHNESASGEDPQVRSMLLLLESWQQLLGRCAADRGWAVCAHVIAASEASLAVVLAAVRGLASTDAAGAGDLPAQEWDVQRVTAAATARPVEGWLSSADLGLLLVPPGEALGSVQVRRALPGGRRQPPMPRPLHLGTWLGTDVPAGLDVDDLAGHAFVAGITGSGKSTTTGRLLVQLWNDHRVPFLVIDPAKADYQSVAPHLDGGLRVVSGEDLVMNVLAPWPGRPVRRHIAHVSTAFRGAFGMPVPVPYVAAMLLEQVAGDSQAGEVTLHDAAARLDSMVAELGYHGEIESNIRASLGLRLRLLLQPGRADRVAGAGPPDWLVDRPTLVQLGDLGDEEERAFIAAMLVLYVADAARARGESSSVHHVTVVEEAHRLMPEPRSASSEDGDAGAVAARLMTQLLAEIRGYGEAVLVVDQSPAAVAREVLRNTSTKLAHRVVDTDDQKSLGGALGLGEDEQPVLGSLTPGRCLLSTRTLLRPQSVEVLRLPPVELSDGFVELPPQPGTGCHGPADAFHHHASERHGSRAELVVGLWATGGGPDDLMSLLRPIGIEDPAVRPACLAAVGIRRVAAGLRRIGHLAPEASAPYTQSLWDAALSRGPRPRHPGAGRPGPFPGCRLCPVPCTARAVVEAGAVPGRARLSTRAERTEPRDLLRVLQEGAGEVRGELSAQVGTLTAVTAGLCSALHEAARMGRSESFAVRLEKDMGGGDA